MSLRGKWIIRREDCRFPALESQAHEIIGVGADYVEVPEGRVPGYILPNYRLATEAEIRAAQGKRRAKRQTRRTGQPGASSGRNHGRAEQ